MLLRIWNGLEETIIGLLLVATTLLVCVEVFMRFVLNSGFIWMQELTLLLSAWMVLLGASYGVRVGAHIGVDAFIIHLSPAIRRLLGMLSVLLSILYCGLVGYGAYIYLHKIQRIGLELQDMPFPKWIAHSVLLIGMALLALRLLELLIHIIRGQALGFEIADEAAKALDEAKKVGAAK